MLDGLDGSVIDNIKKGLEEQTINTTNLDAVITKIKRIKKEKVDGNSK